MPSKLSWSWQGSYAPALWSTCGGGPFAVLIAHAPFVLPSVPYVQCEHSLCLLHLRQHAEALAAVKLMSMPLDCDG